MWHSSALDGQSYFFRASLLFATAEQAAGALASAWTATARVRLSSRPSTLRRQIHPGHRDGWSSAGALLQQGRHCGVVSAGWDTLSKAQRAALALGAVEPAKHISPPRAPQRLLGVRRPPLLPRAHLHLCRASDGQQAQLADNRSSSVSRTT